jgi:HTH-type transcriptional regulator/antitoxin HipB
MPAPVSYRIALPDQLSAYLKSLRKHAGLTQQQLGQRLGLSQRMVAKLEAHPEKSSFERILAMLSALDADLVIQQRQAGHVAEPRSEPYRAPDADAW